MKLSSLTYTIYFIILFHKKDKTRMMQSSLLPYEYPYYSKNRVSKRFEKVMRYHVRDENGNLCDIIDHQSAYHRNIINDAFRGMLRESLIKKMMEIPLVIFIEFFNDLSLSHIKIKNMTTKNIEAFSGEIFSRWKKIRSYFFSSKYFNGIEIGSSEYKEEVITALHANYEVECYDKDLLNTLVSFVPFNDFTRLFREIREEDFASHESNIIMMGPNSTERTEYRNSIMERIINRYINET